MAAGDGIPEFVTPGNTSQFEQMISDIRAHFLGVKGQAEVVGHDLRRLLPRARNVNARAGMMGLDLRAAAWQVARQFNQIAAAQNASASAATKALEIYHGNFTSTGGAGSHRQFDAGR
jgi:hypothetical protein